MSLRITLCAQSSALLPRTDCPQCLTSSEACPSTLWWLEAMLHCSKTRSQLLSRPAMSLTTSGNSCSTSPAYPFSLRFQKPPRPLNLKSNLLMSAPSQSSLTWASHQATLPTCTDPSPCHGPKALRACLSAATLCTHPSSSRQTPLLCLPSASTQPQVMLLLWLLTLQTTLEHMSMRLSHAYPCQTVDKFATLLNSLLR